MKLRVLQIIPTLVRGGAEKQLTLLATGLPRDEFDVHVGVLTHDGPYHDTLRAADVSVEIIDKRHKVDPVAYYRLKRHITALRPDIVHTWIFAANSYGRQAAIAAGVKHIIAGERCVDSWKVWHELAIDRYLARRTNKIVTNSSGVREFYVGHGLPAEKFAIIPNGIDSLNVDRETSRRELRKELDLPERSQLIGAVGRLWPQKRYKDLIWALELLRSVRDDAHLLIVGDGPQRAMLERYCRQVRTDDRIHFLGSRSDVPHVLAGLDCFWLGSGYEGQSNALMEAMMVGLPVVVTDIAGNRDLVVDGAHGQLIPVGDAAGFASATSQFLEDSDRAEGFGCAARQRMLEEFSVSRMIDRYAELYRETS